MKIKYIIVIAILASLTVLTGAFFKIMHWPFANILLIAGLTAETISVILLLLKSVLNKNINQVIENK
jgi:hypothetical protein